MLTSVSSKKRNRVENLESRCVNVSIDRALELKACGDVKSALGMLEGIIARDDAVGKRNEIALYELALLYCQLGNGSLADEFLSRLGIGYRLSCDIFAPKLSSKNAISACPFATAFDNILPPELLASISEAFSPTSIFWTAHSYPTPQFFSYNVPLNGIPASLISQLVGYLLPFVNRAFPKKAISKRVKSVEWWAHMRQNTEAHQMHFDLDEIMLLNQRATSSTKKASKIVPTTNLHPLVSAVLYLNPGSAFPTVVTNQILQRESMATEAWICQPAANRLLLFDGSLLHGVVPQISTAAASIQPRIT
jgi:hypothetical protein